MARIAICWELGGGLGHIVRLSEVADRLADLGHEPVFVLREPGAALRYWRGLRHRTLAAPTVYIGPRTQADVSWADVLWIDCGFHDAGLLEAIWCAWHDLLRVLEPELLLVDGAPVALGAAAALGAVRVEASNAFFLPPATPWPPFRDWDRAPTAHLAPREALLLDRANAARARVGVAPAATLDAVFARDHRLLFTLPEIDLYAPRSDAEYVGPVAGAASGEAPRWPDGAGPRVFVYLKRDYAAYERVLGALARLTEARIVYFGDGDTPALPAHVAVHERPVDAASAMADADAVVCHAGNLVATALLAGKPVLALPMQAEQINVGVRLAATGAGLAVSPFAERPDLLGPLRKLLADATFRTAAQRIAATHRGTLDPTLTAQRVAQWCDARLRVKA